MPMKKDYRKLVKIGVIVGIIIAGIIISGCISGENSQIQAQTTPMKTIAELPSNTSTASPIDQTSDVNAAQLILKPDDVPGFTLNDYNFISVPQNSSFNPNTQTTTYTDVLPFGYRNVGQTLSWSGDEGTLDIMIYKYDSNSEIKESITKSNTECETMKNNSGEEALQSWGCGSPDIGDYSWYTYSTPYENNSNIVLTQLKFNYGNYYTEIVTVDDKEKSLNETIQVAKILRSRLN